MRNYLRVWDALEGDCKWGIHWERESPSLFKPMAPSCKGQGFYSEFLARWLNLIRTTVFTPPLNEKLSAWRSAWIECTNPASGWCARGGGGGFKNFTFPQMFKGVNEVVGLIGKKVSNIFFSPFDFHATIPIYFWNIWRLFKQSESHFPALWSFKALWISIFSITFARLFISFSWFSQHWATSGFSYTAKIPRGIVLSIVLKLYYLLQGYLEERKNTRDRDTSFQFLRFLVSRLRLAKELYVNQKNAISVGSRSFRDFRKRFPFCFPFFIRHSCSVKFR